MPESVKLIIIKVMPMLSFSQVPYDLVYFLHFPEQRLITKFINSFIASFEQIQFLYPSDSLLQYRGMDAQLPAVIRSKGFFIALSVSRKLSCSARSLKCL